MNKIVTKRNLSNILLALFFIAMGNIFIIQFKMGEKFIYYWDISGYWIRSIEFSNLLFTDFSEAMTKLYQSILHDDYTLLPVLFYVPTFRFISQSNFAFVLTTYNVFGVPFLALMYVFLLKQFDIKCYLHKAMTLLVLFTCTIFMAPLMGGFLDACGLTFIAALLLMMQGWDLKRVNIVRCLCLMLLILMICFLRRWYSFWVVGFFVAFFVAEAFKQGREGLKNGKTLMAFLNLFIAGAVWLVVLFLFFKDFLVRMISSNLSFAYSAYDMGGIGYNLNYIKSETGIFFLLLTLGGVIISFVKRKHVFYSVFLALQSIIMLIMFTHVQSLGIQHMYLFVPMILYFSVYCAITLPSLVANKKAAAASYAVIVLMVCLNFFNSYFKHDNPAVNFASPLFTQKRLYKRMRNDIEQINAIVQFLNEQSENRLYTYVLSSSPILNCDILINAKLPYERFAVNKLFYTLDVDKRDGFPYAFYAADFLVVPTPVQYHLAPSDQQTVVILAEAVLSGKAGNTLQLIAQYPLDDSVTANIYKRTGAYSHEFINAIDEAFKQAYPGEDFEFINDTITMYSYIANMNLQQGKNILLPARDEMGMELGNEEAGFDVHTENEFSTLQLDIIANYEAETTGKFLTITNDLGEEVGRYEIKGGTLSVAIDVSSQQDVHFLFTSGENSIENIYITIAGFMLTE